MIFQTIWNKFRAEIPSLVLDIYAYFVIYANTGVFTLAVAL